MNMSAYEKNDWKLRLDKDDILIYTRSVESSKFNEFLAQAKMVGSIDEFKAIMLDVYDYANWMPDCKSVEIIDNSTPDDITYHMMLKVPFPFTNRDVVQQLLFHEEEDVLEIKIINQSSKVEEIKKHVRMVQAQGQWTVKEVSDNEISIAFQYFADPGGDIPAWLVNSFIVKNPHLTLLKIKEKLTN